MASSANGNQQDKKKKKSGRDRGTVDEMEVLKLIIEEHPTLRSRVLGRIREIRSDFSTSFLEEIQKKQDDLRGSQKNIKNRKIKGS